jgi:hypothetical protein
MATAILFDQLPLPSRGPELTPQPPPAAADSRFRELCASFAPELARSITSGKELIRRLDRTDRPQTISTSIAAIDELLGGGLRRGTFVEVEGRRSSGRFAVVLATLAATTSQGEAAALIDLGDHLDPEGAQQLGVDLGRLLWVRPSTTRDAVAAAEMLLTTGFPLVALDLGLVLRGSRVVDSAWIRLGRAAASHGSAFLLSAPFHVSGTAPDAVIRSGSSRGAWQGGGRTPSLLTGVEGRWERMRHRQLRPGGSTTVELDAAEKIRPARRSRIVRLLDPRGTRE